MRIAYITAGAAGMYCGTCMHDNTLAAALIERGHEVSLTPTYTPMRTDEPSVAGERIFFGAINVYLQQKVGLFRHTPRFLDRLLDGRRLLSWVSRFAGSTDAHDLGAMTLAMLEGESGANRKELDKLVGWLEEILEPEVVHLSSTLFLGFAGEIRRCVGVPVVCSLQGEDIFFDGLPEPYLSQVLGEVRRRAADVDAFTAPCRYYAELMSDKYGVPRQRIHLARLGIHTDGFEAAPQRPADAPVTVGYLARVCPEKGLHQLVDAFHLLAPELPTLRLRVAGYCGERDRPYLEEQRRRLDARGLAERVDFVGEVDRQGKIDFLRSLDVLSVPTVYREPKGLFLLEALACGVPVVQPRHGGFPEWIENTGGGLLVDPGSPQALAAGLRRLAEGPEQRRELGRIGRAAVLERYDHHAMADEMLTVYDRVLAEPRRSAAG